MLDWLFHTIMLLIERELIKLEPELQQLFVAQLTRLIEIIMQLVEEKLESCDKGHISLDCQHDDDDLQ
jgi:hypothetical protein